MADTGLQAVLGPEEKESLRPKMEKITYAPLFWMEEVPKRVFFADFMDFSAGSTAEEGLIGRNLLD